MFKVQNVKVKKYLIFLVVLLLLLCVFLFNILHHNHNAEYSNNTVKSNISAISKFDFSKVTTVENQVKALNGASSSDAHNTSGNTSKAQYQKIFGSSIVIGDSITEGLRDYGFLGSDQVFCKIGASVMQGDDLFDSASHTYPKFAFFAFGMNDMGNYNGNTARFTAKYKSMLKAFKAKSPNTHIYINSISIPSDEAMARNKSIRNYNKFNNALKSMCDELHITYIDNTFILKDNKSYYAADGIHVLPAYYNKWLNNMIMKAGL